MKQLSLDDVLHHAGVPCPECGHWYGDQQLPCWLCAVDEVGTEAALKFLLRADADAEREGE